MYTQLGIFICIIGCIVAENGTKHEPSGVYKFTFETPEYMRTEERDINGTIVGEYSYTNTEGEIETIKYESGVDGFKILSGNLPIAPIDYNLQVPEPFELQEERRKHLDLHMAWVKDPQSFVPEVLFQLEDTPEVMKAKQEHLDFHKRIEMNPLSFMLNPKDFPMPVEYTDEVKKAREEFLKNYQAQIDYFESLKEFRKIVNEIKESDL